MNKEDSITVAHISDDRNTDLAEEYKPENIMDFYKTECISRVLFVYLIYVISSLNPNMTYF